MPMREIKAVEFGGSFKLEAEFVDGKFMGLTAVVDGKEGKVDPADLNALITWLCDVRSASASKEVAYYPGYTSTQAVMDLSNLKERFSMREAKRTVGGIAQAPDSPIEPGDGLVIEDLTEKP